MNTSNNYFVITDRDDTGNVDCGIKDIYELHTSQKYATIHRIYSDYLDIIDDVDNTGGKLPLSQIDTVITEDSKLGCKFYQYLYNKNTISAYNNAQIEESIKKNINSNLFVVVDGSVFGKYIQSVNILISENPNIHLFAPESFEYLLLKANILERANIPGIMYFDGVHINDILNSPENYIDITKYTREQYYTMILKQCMSETGHPYSKSSDDAFYISSKLLSDVRKIIPIVIDEKAHKDINKMNIDFSR